MEISTRNNIEPGDMIIFGTRHAALKIHKVDSNEKSSSYFYIDGPHIVSTIDGSKITLYSVDENTFIWFETNYNNLSKVLIRNHQESFDSYFKVIKGDEKHGQGT